LAGIRHIYTGNNVWYGIFGGMGFGMLAGMALGIAVPLIPSLAMGTAEIYFGGAAWAATIFELIGAGGASAVTINAASQAIGMGTGHNPVEETFFADHPILYWLSSVALLVSGPAVAAESYFQQFRLCVESGVIEGAGNVYKTGDLYESRIVTSNGITVDGLADVSIDGKTVTLSNATVYPVGGDMPNQVGYTELKTWINQTAAEFKALGYEKLNIEGIRIQNSTSANPGSRWTKTIDLTK